MLTTIYYISYGLVELRLVYHCSRRCFVCKPQMGSSIQCWSVEILMATNLLILAWLSIFCERPEAMLCTWCLSFPLNMYKSQKNARDYEAFSSNQSGSICNPGNFGRTGSGYPRMNIWKQGIGALYANFVMFLAWHPILPANKDILV